MSLIIRPIISRPPYSKHRRNGAVKPEYRVRFQPTIGSEWRRR